MHTYCNIKNFTVRNFMKHSVNQTGFTLIEMLITVAIMGIVSMVAVPSFQKQIAQRKQEDSAKTLEMALKQARSDTLIYRVPVIVGIQDNKIITAQAVGNNPSCTITSSHDDKTCKVVTQALDKKIKVDVKNLTGGTVYFTVDKKAYMGSPSDDPKNTIPADDGIVYGFCYDGNEGSKYAVTLSPIGNVSMERLDKSKESCS